MDNILLVKKEDFDALRVLLEEHLESVHVTAEQIESWDRKADSGVVGGTNRLGLVKPYSQNNVNRSGIIFYEDGSIAVYALANYGLTRTGDGKLVVAAASDADIQELKNEYKPIVPAKLNKAVQVITGDFSALETQNKASLVAAVNELAARIKALESK